jgi:hypothetical protein
MPFFAIKPRHRAGLRGSGLQILVELRVGKSAKDPVLLSDQQSFEQLALRYYVTTCHSAESFVGFSADPRIDLAIAVLSSLLPIFTVFPLAFRPCECHAFIP